MFGVDHDQICKKLIEAFFEEFVSLFYPQLAAEIDFSEVEFLRNEQFTDQPKGNRRSMDLVVKVRLLSGADRFLLIHFEFESDRPDEDFPRRIFAYNCQLFLRYGTDIVPIVIFTDDAQWRKPVSNSFQLGIAGLTSVQFEYQLIKLKSLDYREFLDSQNPLAYALMAKMNYDQKQRVRLKADFLRLILGAKKDRARQSLLIDFVETYVPLVGIEQTEFMSLIANEQIYEEVQEMVTVYEQAGIEKGIEKGIEGLRITLIQLLEKKFGIVPDWLSQQIRSLDSMEGLQRLILRVFDVDRVDQLLG